MNRFEKGVADCMVPTAELLAQTTKPLHKLEAERGDRYWVYDSA